MGRKAEDARTEERKEDKSAGESGIGDEKCGKFKGKGTASNV